MDPEEFRRQLKKWAVVGSFFALALLFYFLQWRRWLVAYVLIVGALSVVAILIQSGRGGGLAASLGGLGGDSLFGARSATPIARATYVMLALFIVICMLIARLPTLQPQPLVGPPPIPRPAPPPVAQPAAPPAATPEQPPLAAPKPPEPSDGGATQTGGARRND